MKKKSAVILSLIVVGVAIAIWFGRGFADRGVPVVDTIDLAPEKKVEELVSFQVYSGTMLHSAYKSFAEAVDNAKNLAQASVRIEDSRELLWDNYKDFTVYQSGRFLSDFVKFDEAVKYAKKFADTDIYYRKINQPIWEYGKLPIRTSIIDAPQIAQMPELPRGCEVTSLAMMLQFADVKVDKLELAKTIKKDLTPYKKVKGVIYYGNPYDGFIGDMYTFSKPGYGVYHGPVKELAENYLPGRVIDMTGSSFEDILQPLSYGNPVWVISNTWFSYLPNSLFQTWETPSGPVNITYKEHSVLITGFDETYIYFNDPLADVKNRKIKIASFRDAWEQMGSQAITFI